MAGLTQDDVRRSDQAGSGERGSGDSAERLPPAPPPVGMSRPAPAPVVTGERAASGDPPFARESAVVLSRPSMPATRPSPAPRSPPPPPPLRRAVSLPPPVPAQALPPSRTTGAPELPPAGDPWANVPASAERPSLSPAAERASLYPEIAQRDAEQARRALYDTQRKLTALEQKHAAHIGEIERAHDARINELDRMVSEGDARINELDRSARVHDAHVAELDRTVRERDARIAELGRAARERDARIAELDRTVRERDARIAALDASVRERDARIAILDASVHERDARIATFEAGAAAQRAAAEAAGEDLRRIAGIGPAFAKRLAALGVNRVAQIAAWTIEDADRFATAIGTTQLRIARDRWIENARELVGAPS